MAFFAAARVTLACWVVFELALRVRELRQGKGGGARDRATRVLIGLSLGAAIALALWARTAVPSLRAPGAVRALGLVAMWVGLAIRAWAVVALGGAFRTTVEVDADQAVVTTGPYRRVRHPSYTGLLLIVAGFGLAIGSWLSFAVCLVVPLPSIVRRIGVEEAELERVLGDAYRNYRRGTRRLVPRLW